MDIITSIKEFKIWRGVTGFSIGLAEGAYSLFVGITAIAPPEKEGVRILRTKKVLAGIFVAAMAFG